ncbi:MAG: AMP-binding protein [Deltaproteobacteria bacterium]|nr:AMP-binding protein [Deltaproteobacteria bacterium]
MAKHTGEVGFFAGEVLDQTAQSYPDKTALIAREGKLTFAQLREQVKNLAGHLRAEGIKSGDRVGLLLPNSIAFTLAYYASQRIGAVTVVLDARLRGKELAAVLRDADLRLLITHGRLMPEISTTVQEFRRVPLWVVGAEGETSFEKRLSSAPVALDRLQLNADDDALVLYTSGTTGDPKGVVLNYINLAQFPLCTAEAWKTNSESVWACILPMSHIAGPILCNETIAKGSALVIIDQFNPITLLEAIQRHRITIFPGVPALFQLLLGVPRLKDYDTRSLRAAGMMGMTVPAPLLRAFKAAQPHVAVIQGYGLTETSPMITAVPLEAADEKMGSIGRAVRGIEVRIVDDEGQEVPVGEPGEIITRGPHVMKGYFRRPEATAERIRDGWLYTGDIGKVDKDGFYYHLGRKDDLIITGGLNVYPAEIENLLYEQPQVQDAVVFPIPDKKRGNVIGAAVVLGAGQTITEKELLAVLRANLARFKVPQKLKICDALPRTSSGKVIRDPQLLLSE